jgi:thiol peroxidase
VARITLKGNPLNTSGELPAIGSTARDFSLVQPDLSEATLQSFAGKKKILNVYASIDTGVCATSLKTFLERTSSRSDVVVLNISEDLPFASKRFCAAEGAENAVTLSTFRSSFPDDYGLRIIDVPIAGLCSRCVIVLDENNKVVHTEQVPEHVQEPDYDAALAVL